MTEPRLSVVIVAWNEAEALRETLPALVPELAQDDEIVVADNGSVDGTPELVAELAPEARIVSLGSNRGFPVACNAAVEAASGDLVLILNPDARPQPGFGAAIRRPWVEGRGWAAWMGLVTQDGGRKVNTAGNPVHYTGFAWAGQNGEPVPASIEPHEVPSVSGACFCVPRETWLRQRGFPEPYVLYHEDIDLSNRLRLEGGRLGIEPGAIVDHDYEFGRRPEKMRWMERNRAACVIRTYPGPLLAVVAPALLLTEIAMLAIAIASGWGRQKLLADIDVLRRIPWALRERRRIQAGRTISAAEFAAGLTADLDSPYFGRVGRSRLLRGLLRLYWAIARRLLGRPPAELP